MAINSYGRKIEENLNEVRYSYGCDYNNLSGELLINKKNLELIKIVDSSDKTGNIAFFKIGCKAIKIFEKESAFPEFVDSVS